MDDNGIWTGAKLKALVDSPLPIRNPLIENFLYERTVMMTYASSGVGKSTICLCACLQASAGVPVFGCFKVPRPLKIYYVLGERDVTEPAERMQLMKKVININYNNIIIDEEAIGRNMLEKSSEIWMIRRIKEAMPDVDLIVFDPIYSLASGGLSSPEKATAFAQFSSRVQRGCNKCSIWHNNHTVKSLYEIIEGSKQAKTDPYMGSELLKAHVNVMYHIQQKDDLVQFDKKKDSHNNAQSHIKLRFDIESYTLEAISKESTTVNDRLNLFLDQCKRDNKTFTFDHYYVFIKPVVPSYAQKLLGITLRKGLIINLSPAFTKALYQVL